MLMVFLLFTYCDTDPDMSSKEIIPPIAEKFPHELSLHDEVRVDNYYWMRLTDEQKNAANPDGQTQKVLAYLQAENNFTKAIMADTEDLQDSLFKEIVGRIRKDDFSVPYFKNGYWYYTRYEAKKEYPLHCRKKKSLEAKEEILLNVNELAEGFDYFHVTGLNVSPDNKMLAYGEDTLSRRVYRLKIKNLETGELLSDQIENTTGGSVWANDNHTLFYTSKNKITLLSEKIYKHTLGSKTDKVVYHEEDPAYYIGVYKSKSDKYIIIWNSSTLSSDFHLIPADKPDSDPAPFTPREEVLEYDIEHYNGIFYIVTNWNARNFRLMKTGEGNTEKGYWQEVIPHREEVLLQGIEVFKDYLVISERKNGLTRIRVKDHRSDAEHHIDFGESAYMAYISINPEMDTDLLRYGYSSLTTPFTTYDYNMTSRVKTVKKREEVVGGHEPEDYITERLYAETRDGKKVPVSIVYRNDFKKDGNGPLLLYGYGSYGATIDPSFNSARLSLIDRGFAFAIAHIRGSQTLGREWYEDGKMLKKKNTFNDFIDCARFLIDHQYTNPDQLFAMGGSAGGLLMGAVVNMAPELFKGVVAVVPFIDVVTTMSDPTIPLTTNEFDEWGHPAENREEYDYMLSYSPYDNVKQQQYPNMLVMTGLFDSQVQYWEPAKWVARLRELKTDDNLLLLHTNMEAGHGGASGRFERYKETALEYAFILKLAGVDQ